MRWFFEFRRFPQKKIGSNKHSVWKSLFDSTGIFLLQGQINIQSGKVFFDSTGIFLLQGQINIQSGKVFFDSIQLFPYWSQIKMEFIFSYFDLLLKFAI